MSENRIRGISIKLIAGSRELDVRAEAEVVGSEGAVQVVASSGVRAPSDSDTAHRKQLEDAQLSELRKRLYAVGFSKRAIATAVKSIVRVETRQN